MAKNNQNNPVSYIIPLGDINADATFSAFKTQKKLVIQKVSLMNAAAITADNTNYVVVQLKNGANTVIADIDTRAAGDGAIVAFEGKDVIPEGGNEYVIEQATNLKVDVNVQGTTVLTDATLQIYGFHL